MLQEHELTQTLTLQSHRLNDTTTQQNSMVQKVAIPLVQPGEEVAIATENVPGALVKTTDRADYRVDGTDGSETEVARTATYNLLASGATFTKPVHRIGEEVTTAT